MQAGRYRQHTQFDIECIGEPDPAVDYEVMSVAWTLFLRLGFGDLSFQVNSTGCPACRPAYLERLVAYYRGHGGSAPTASAGWSGKPAAHACSTARRPPPASRLSPRRHISPTICRAECADHFGALRQYLDATKRPYTVNHRLVRGLDYYTKTVFEVWAAGIGAQNAVCGGGRYDGLAEQLGGEHTPGIGFGSGIERLVLTMKEQGIQVPGAPRQDLAVVYIGAAAKARAVEVVNELRLAGLRTTIAYGDRSMRAQLRAADRDGVSLARYWVMTSWSAAR